MALPPGGGVCGTWTAFTRFEMKVVRALTASLVGALIRDAMRQEAGLTSTFMERGGGGEAASLTGIKGHMAVPTPTAQPRVSTAAQQPEIVARGLLSEGMRLYAGERLRSSRLMFCCSWTTGLTLGVPGYC